MECNGERWQERQQQGKIVQYRMIERDDGELVQESIELSQETTEFQHGMECGDVAQMEFVYEGSREMQESVFYELECKEVEIGTLQIENELLKEENRKLKDDNMNLKEEVVKLRCNSSLTHTMAAMKRHLTKRFGACYLDEDDNKVCFYTGLPTYKVFNGLFRLLEPLMRNDGAVKSYSLLFDEFLMVLMKHRLATPNEDLGYRFDIDPSQVSRIFHKWIHVMSLELKCLIAWPDPDNL